MSKARRGTYIVLEGPEGTGKTTQLLELERRLRAAGLPVRTMREPDSQTDLTARAIRHLTQDPRYPMNTRTEVLLYNAARAQSLEVIRKSIDQGVICIVDRNYLTTLAIQYYGRGDVPDYDTINSIVGFAVGGVEPDLCIVLDAPVNTLRARVATRYQGERFDNLDESFLERVRAGYLWEAKQRDFPVIFATDPIEEVADAVWKLVAHTLGKRSDNTPAAPTSVGDVIAQRELPAPHEPPFAAELEDRVTKTSVYYTPEQLKPAVKKQYNEALDAILNLHDTIARSLANYMKAHPAVSADERDAALCLVLPIATVPIEQLSSLESSNNTQLNALAQEYLADVRTDGSTRPVTLIDYWPKNEMLLVPDMLYEQSDLSLEHIETAVSAWSYDKKAHVLQAYMKQPGPALERAQYSWDIVSDYSVFRSMQQQQVGQAVRQQQLTPRYGYEVPQIIEDAGLIEQFEACFDVSLKLHSLLQREGYALEAQYATLFGHRTRWKATYTADHVLRVLTANKLTLAMQEQLADVHPQLAEATKT